MPASSCCKIWTIFRDAIFSKIILLPDLCVYQCLVGGEQNEQSEQSPETVFFIGETNFFAAVTGLVSS